MHLLVLGANSDIAQAAAAVFARQEGAHLYLASRDLESLERRAKDLELRYQVKTEVLAFDALDYASHAGFYQRLDPKPDGVLLAFGFMGEQSRSQRDFEQARRVLEVNLMAAVSILEIVAADFEAKGRGFIIGLASPAGERGRQSNYIYGTAKGGLIVYLSGLRHRLHRSGVRVLTVLPGFVNTKMTQGLDLPGLLVAEPEEAARDIYRAFKRGKDRVYSKWFWRYIMLIIRWLPERVFKRTNL